MVMSATAIELRQSDPGRERILNSPQRIIAVFAVLIGVLGFQITNAIADASPSPGTVAASQPTVAQAYLVQHLVPPVPTTVAGSAGVSKPTAPRVTASLPVRPAPKVSSPTAIRIVTPARPAAARVTAPVTPAATSTYGCGAALSYLSTHAAPGFHFECPGYALGHQAMTCINVAGVCPGSHLIVISDPCSAAYMNEASNSWVMEGLRRAPIDPYGYCH
jgi:hypothetical protein